MAKVTILLLSMFCALSVSGGVARLSNPPAAQEETRNEELTDQNAIKVNIATVGPMLGPPTNRYRFGEQIPVTISVTNMTGKPMYACVSSDLYQDNPKLAKDGQSLPYTHWQTSLMRSAQTDHTCQRYDLPEQILLRPDKPTIVDWIILNDDRQQPTGALAWYDPLTPGVYELSLQTRFGCCDGPMIQSNTISFLVTP